MEIIWVATWFDLDRIDFYQSQISVVITPPPGFLNFHNPVCYSLVSDVSIFCLVFLDTPMAQHEMSPARLCGECSAPYALERKYLGWCICLESSESWVHNDSLLMDCTMFALILYKLRNEDWALHCCTGTALWCTSRTGT